MTAPGQVRHAFPAFKVYIFGTDVTEDVLDVTVSWQVGRAPNSCSITLNNELDKYIFTTSDLKLLYDQAAITDAAFNIATTGAGYDPGAGDLGGQPMETQEAIDQAIMNAVDTITPAVKRNILRAKVIQRVPNVKVVDIDGTSTSRAALNGDALRYPFQAEDPVFHPNDPVRVFFRDPFNPRRWYHMFAGFCSNFDDAVDENNQKILTIGCEGPLKQFRYARITTNPGIIDINALPVAGVDAVTRSAYVSGFSNLTLPELIFVMVFGNDPDKQLTTFSVERELADGKTVKAGRFQGIGNYNFKRSAVIEFGPSSPGGSNGAQANDPLDIGDVVPVIPVGDLAVYQSAIDHEVKETDLTEMLPEEAEDAEASVETEKDNMRRDDSGNILPEDIIDFIGIHPELYPVDGGRVIILVPASFHASVNREVLMKSIMGDKFAPLHTEFRSRLGVIYDIIERLEWCFYESPRGDLIAEFPLYDLNPDDWNKNDPPRLAEHAERHHEIIDRGLEARTAVSRGPFARRYFINKRDTYNFSKQINDEKVRTQIAGYYHTVRGVDEVGNSLEYQAPEVITLNHLVPLYGLRLEQAQPQSYVADKTAAHLYAHVMINRMNADAKNMGINAVPNFGSWLNRPHFFQERNCIGTTVMLTHSIKWGVGGSADTRYNFSYVRGWDGSLDDRGEPKYTNIGGDPSRVLNYAELFGLHPTETKPKVGG